MAVYKKIARLQAEIRGLSKDQKAYGYDYVTGNKLLSEVRPRMVEMGLLLLPSVTEISNAPVAYEAYNKQTRQVDNKTEILCTLRMQMKWVDTEDGEVVVEEWAATGMNAFDKGFGSALTYGERYYLLKALHIPTDRDDVDAISAERDEAIAAVAQQKQQAGQQQIIIHRQPVGNNRQINQQTFDRLVAAHAQGKVSQTGETPRDYFRASFQPTPEQLSEFDEAVNNYRINNNI